MTETERTVTDAIQREYRAGFVTDIASDTLPPGLDEEVVRFISARKDEPDWLTQWRLAAYRHWRSLTPPTWAHVAHPPIDFESISYYSSPKQQKDRPQSLADVDPELLRTYERLGIPLHEQGALAGVAVDAVFDSVSIGTTFKDKLKEAGVIFCAISEAVHTHPDLVQKYLGSVVPVRDNYYAALNSAVFSDGSFVFIPKGVRCPMELSTYFRINARNTGQFERTLIIAEDGAYVSYLEGCLPEWEEVSYGDQMRGIRDVAVNDTVLNHRGEEADVAKIMRRAYRADMVEVTPRSPGNRFHLTPEHPVLAIKRSRVCSSSRGPKRWADISPARLSKADPEFVPAGELNAGDLLVFPINQVERDDTSLSDDFLRLLGYYVAEGCVTKLNGCDAVEWCLGDHEEDFADDISELTFRLTGKCPSRAHDAKRHGLYLVVYSKTLCALMEQHGGKYAQGKRFSKAVMDLPPARQRLAIDTFCRGVGGYRGDGSESREGTLTRVRALTVSRTLAFQLQEMLARQGIFAYINIREASEETMRDGHVVRHRRAYVIYYSRNARSRRAIRRNGYFLVPVRSIARQPYDGFVYNFETKDEPHSYLVKGFAVHNCTAPMRDENQLHAAVVELVALTDAQIKYSTVQNWYPGDAEGKGGIYNFVTKRGACIGDRSKISWTQVETGSAITWKYPSVVLRGNDSRGEFYSVALTNHLQQADTGTKMIHLGRNTKSTIVSKGISAGRAQNSYRGLVRISPTAVGARNYTQCDSLLIGDRCGAHTFPYIESSHSSAIVEHEATTSKVSDDQLFLCQQRGIDPEKAIGMIVNGFCREVFRELPMEFAVEAGRLLEVSLEGAVG